MAWVSCKPLWLDSELESSHRNGFELRNLSVVL